MRHMYDAAIRAHRELAWRSSRLQGNKGAALRPALERERLGSSKPSLARTADGPLASDGMCFPSAPPKFPPGRPCASLRRRRDGNLLVCAVRSPPRSQANTCLINFPRPHLATSRNVITSSRLALYVCTRPVDPDLHKYGHPRRPGLEDDLGSGVARTGCAIIHGAASACLGECTCTENNPRLHSRTRASERNVGADVS